MKQTYKTGSLAVLFFSVSQIAIAGPWFTGPILAPAGHTIPKGHTNFELYGFKTEVTGIYDDQGHVNQVPDIGSISVNPVLSYGLTDKIDGQLVVTYNDNHQTGVHSKRMGDTNIGLGYQLLEQKDARWRPDLRVTLQEILPTGRFDHLNPVKLGTDSTGLGSHQTALNLNFQHLVQLADVNYLRTRLSMGYVKASDVHIEGLSAYGGTALTSGKVNPGNTVGADLAAELSLTQNWVAVMEVNASNRQATKFSGQTGFSDVDDFDTIGHSVGKQVSLAPAIEYNFSPNVGIISGVWFPVYGRNTAKFTSYVVALNAYW